MGHTNMCDNLGIQKRLAFFENERLVTMAYSEKFNRFDLVTYVTKMHLPFQTHIRIQL